MATKEKTEDREETQDQEANVDEEAEGQEEAQDNDEQASDEEQQDEEQQDDEQASDEDEDDFFGQFDNELPILQLDIQPINLDLLGLTVHLDRVRAQIGADSESGKLVGNLLTQLLKLLDALDLSQLSGMATEAIQNLVGDVIKGLGDNEKIKEALQAGVGKLASKATDKLGGGASGLTDSVTGGSDDEDESSDEEDEEE